MTRQILLGLAVAVICTSGCDGCQRDASENARHLDTSYDAASDAPSGVDTTGLDSTGADATAADTTSTDTTSADTTSADTTGADTADAADAVDTDTGATPESAAWFCTREIAASCDPAQLGAPCGTNPTTMPSSNCQGRCREGVIRCEDGRMVCKSLRRRMPETCNGLDDDCSGYVDDLSDSWSRPLFSAIDPTNDDIAKACHQRDICACPTPPDEDYVGSGASFADEYRAYMDGWGSQCYCVDE